MKPGQILLIIGMLRYDRNQTHTRGQAALKGRWKSTAMQTDVWLLRVPHATGSLSKAMHQIVGRWKSNVGIYVRHLQMVQTLAAVLKSDDPARVIDNFKRKRI